MNRSFQPRLEPYQTKSADNRAHIVPRPANAWPQAMAGFTVTEFAAGLVNPRLVRRAPNSDKPYVTNPVAVTVP